ncbi:RNA polymerase II subunit A C-terminal domain phosphatase isoform X1 [Brachyhypopomus gauderio]|uniref:RNA polymerase II subunit A C-terminal domain phosphatase isoform X1 n=1 Tax=Brachyhypopomus gauderio TaxID=698409 RepID=UPI0040410200
MEDAAPLAPRDGVTEVRCPAGAAHMRLSEWRVKPGALVNVDSVIAVCVALPTQDEVWPEERSQSDRLVLPEKKVKSHRAGVVRELCCHLGQLVSPGDVIVRIEECNHPVVMKGLCAECGQDLTQLQNKNGKQQAPISTATVSMVHSVPELMVSSEQAEQLGREDQKRLHRNRKLVLMVDLDQTLIHTTEQCCQRMSNKGIFHFQLGRGEPMLHTRLRPHCKEFLEKIAKMYELHVFTFGSRLYAHTIAGFLDPEKNLFSHRILSRDECIDPFSKTGNLRNLFPCGDSMVCIIDDREDVWKFAPNLITVKKYVFFKETGDINAPPGSREPQLARKYTGKQLNQHVENLDHSGTPGYEEQSTVLKKCNKTHKAEQDILTFVSDIQAISAKQRSRIMGKIQTTESIQLSDKYIVKGVEASSSGRMSTSGETGDKEHITAADGTEMGFDLSSESECEFDKPGLTHCKNEQISETREIKQTKLDEDNGARGGNGSLTEAEETTDVDHGVLSDTLNGCPDNSDQSGIATGEESLDHSLEDEEEEEEEEDMDQDDHLIYLEEVLTRIHNEYYTRYESYIRENHFEMPDIRKIVPELKSKSLAGTNIVFSGLYPTNYPMERTREYYHAKALGAKINKSLVLNAKDPEYTTHLIAARAGTEKVRQAQGFKHLHVVNPDWLWGCLERWERVEEKLFPLKEDYTKSQRCNSPSAFTDMQEMLSSAVIHNAPVQPKFTLVPEVRTYDPVTGKLIRRGPQVPCHPSYRQPQKIVVKPPTSETHLNLRLGMGCQPQEVVDDSDKDGENPGPSRRKRQPSMSETMPLYTLCKEDLESMDKEVDDILGEESDNENEEQGKEERVDGEEEQEQEKPQTSKQNAITDHQQALSTVVEDTILIPSIEESSLTGTTQRPARSSPPAPWLTEVLRSNQRELRKAERKWRKSQLDSDLHSYQALLYKFSTEVTTAKSSFYKEKLEESASDPRKLFRIFSSLLKPLFPPPPSSLTPEDFVTFFEEKVNKKCFSPLSTDEVLQLLKSSNPTTCPLDPIPSTLFQTVSMDLSPFITFIMNSSLSSGQVPAAFKTARVVTILKKPTLDSSDVCNYRPNLLQGPNQSGFKPAHSTETALIAVTEKLQTARASKLSSVLILLDLSAAFDTVNHKILLSVLSDLGIAGSAWKWFESYLERRSYQVCSCISACLTDISSWMAAHHLKLNPSKTELLFIPGATGPQQDLAISFENSLIVPSKDARNLGVTLDDQLSFSAHITNLTRSCRYFLYNIRRIRPFLSQEASQVLVQSLVISRLDYCNSLLAGLPLQAIRPLQLIQNAAARLVFNLPKFTHVTPLLRSLHWLPVAARILFKILMLAYKAKNGPAPSYLMAMVKSRSAPRALCASSTARLDPPSLKIYGRHATRCFSDLAPRWWNELPLAIRPANSLTVFKRRLKTHLFVKHL